MMTGTGCKDQTRLGKIYAPRLPHRYYDAVTVGIDLQHVSSRLNLRQEGNLEDNKDLIVRL